MVFQDKAYNTYRLASCLFMVNHYDAKVRECPMLLTGFITIAIQMNVSLFYWVDDVRYSFCKELWLYVEGLSGTVVVSSTPCFHP